MLDISIVVPAYNEEESLPELMAWIDKVIAAMQKSYEVIFIDDGSRDKTWQVITELCTKYTSAKGLKFKSNNGKSAALNVGFAHANGDVVITMDADLQDSPDEIPELFRMIKEDQFDLVSGWKKKRYDPLSKTIPTKLYNAVTRAFTGIKLHDFNCGLKAYKKDVVKSINVYGEMHRYIPVLAKRAGYSNIGEKVVQHQARKYGTTKFGLERFINGPLDLLTILIIGKFGRRPMHFFGSFGVLMFLLGFVILVYLSIDKIFFNVSHIAQRPLFYLGIVTLILGSQMFLTGFLAELFVRHSQSSDNYEFAEKAGWQEQIKPTNI